MNSGIVSRITTVVGRRLIRPGLTENVARPFPICKIGHTASVSNVRSTQLKTKTSSVIDLVNDQVAKKQDGRIFAIVQLDNTQYKISEGDIIVLEGTKTFDVGDRIRLEKIFCVGGRDFTLFGKPLISRDLIDIEATVIEKTLAETRVNFHHVPRKAMKNLQFHRTPLSLLRINRLEIIGEITTDH